MRAGGEMNFPRWLTAAAAETAHEFAVAALWNECEMNINMKLIWN
jgi:hypothetical protein